MADSLQKVINRSGFKLKVNAYREYAEGRSAGFELIDCETDEILFTMDIDVNKPQVVTRIYEISGIHFRGAAPSQMIVDKMIVVSSDKVFRRIKDIIDLYYISRVIEFDRANILKVLEESGQTLGDFSGFLNKKDELRHSYEKFRFSGGIYKPPFDEVYADVKAFLTDALKINSIY